MFLNAVPLSYRKREFKEESMSLRKTTLLPSLLAVMTAIASAATPPGIPDGGRTVMCTPTEAASTITTRFQRPGSR